MGLLVPQCQDAVRPAHSDRRFSQPVIDRTCRAMSTQLIILIIPLPRSMCQLQAHVLSALQQYGEPLRWAITKIQSDGVHVEAIVTDDTAVSAQCVR